MDHGRNRNPELPCGDTGIVAGKPLARSTTPGALLLLARSSIATLAILALTACSGPPKGRQAPGAGAAEGPAGLNAAGAASAREGKAEAFGFQVAVSVLPQAWLVERLGAPYVEVQTMLGSGATEHSAELLPRQLVALEQARLYVLVGHPDFVLETQRILPLLRQNRSIRQVDMSEGITFAPEDPGTAHVGAHAHGDTDPHVWLSVSLMRRCAANVERALEAVDPPHAQQYRENLDVLLVRLDELDRSIRAVLGAPPSGSPTSQSAPRRFLVYHPAWGYFASDYGLTQLAIEREGKEPSPMQLIDLIEQVRGLGLHTLFTPRGISTRAASVVAREIGARIVELDPMPSQWDTTMLATARALARGMEP